MANIVRLIQGAPRPPILKTPKSPNDPQRGGDSSPWGPRDNAILQLNADLQNFEAATGLGMNVEGLYSTLTLPAGNLGSEIVGADGTLNRFIGRRGVAGTSGQTTIELELNGVPTGITLEWLSTDPAFSLEETEMSLRVHAGDRLSFRITSAETGARDIFTVASVSRDDS